MTTDNDFDALSGSYALNALDPAERAAFEQHMRESHQTRDEVTELGDTAVLLGLAIAPMTPPPALKASIMAKLGTTPQLPAERGSADASPTDPAQDAPQNALPSVADATPAERKAHARWYASPMTVLAASAAAVALIVGGGVITNGIAANTYQQAQADQLAAINAADDSQRQVSAIDGGGTATLVWSNELGSSALIVDNLQPLPSDRSYQLWYIDSAGARPAGVFPTTDGGSTWRVLDGVMAAGDAVGLTIEPAGGSEIPTTAPIVVVDSA